MGNPRKKYQPWQGEQYGGWLQFEHNGDVLRAVRHFGLNPAQDKFALYRVVGKRLSETNAYSKNLGEELFGIDAASFSRSVFISQEDNDESLSTNSINAKLTGLIEDTNDINNFDKIINRLRDARTDLLPFRGSNGAVNSLQSSISRCETEIGDLESKKDELSCGVQEEESIKRQRAQVNDALNEIRKKISVASLSEGRRVVAGQLDALRKSLNDLEKQKDDLTRKYEGGVPTVADIEAASEAARNCQSLSSPQIEPAAVSKARLDLKHLEDFFASEIPSELDLNGARAKLNEIKVLQGQLSELDKEPVHSEDADAIARSFQFGMPSADLVDECRSLVAELEREKETLAALKASGSSSEETKKYDSEFSSGVPTQEEMGAVRGAILRLSAIETDLSGSALGAERELRLQKLRDIFSRCRPPSFEELDQCSQHLVEAARMRSENASIAAKVVSKRPVAPSRFVLIGVTGIVFSFIVAGMGVMGLSSDSVLQTACYVAAAVLLILGIVLSVKGFSAGGRGNEKSSDQAGLRQRDAETIRRNEEQISGFELEAAKLLDRCGYKRSANLSVDIQSLQRDLREYGDLLEESKKVKKKQARLGMEKDGLSTELANYFSRFGLRGISYEDALSRLLADVAAYQVIARQSSQQESKIESRQTRIDEKSKQLKLKLQPYDIEPTIESLDKVSSQIVRYNSIKRAEEERAGQIEEGRENLSSAWDALKSFLTKYFEKVEIGAAEELINVLQHNIGALAYARVIVEQADELHREREQELENGQRVVDYFFNKYRLYDMNRDVEALKGIDSDVKTLTQLNEDISRKNEEIDNFVNDNKGQLEIDDSTESVDKLNDEEKKLADKYDRLGEAYIAKREENGRLRLKSDQLPEKRDELDSLKSKLSDAQRNVKTFDTTIMYLELAKSGLSATYLDKVKDGFDSYLKAFSKAGLEMGETQISPNLEVEVMNRGMPRELSYFSAGCTDIVTLCMRLALSDALFGDSEAFVMLDDPFANLDGNNLRVALGLLEQVALHRQVVYFACHQSRVPDSAL